MKIFYRLCCIAAVLMAAVACKVVEEENNLPVGGFDKTEKGVFCHFTPIEFDGPATKGVDLSADDKVTFDEKDKINIWSDSKTALFYTLTDINGNYASAFFDGGGFKLTNDLRYTSLYPAMATLEFDAVPMTYTGQVQSTSGSSSHIKNYLYYWADAYCISGHTEFDFTTRSGFIKFKLTFPLTGSEEATIKTVKLVADSNVFATAPTLNAGTGEITNGGLTNEISVALGESGFHVNASNPTIVVYMAVAPFESSVVSVKAIDSESNVYTSSSFTTSVNAGKIKPLTCPNMAIAAANKVYSDVDHNQTVYNYDQDLNDLYVTIVYEPLGTSEDTQTALYLNATSGTYPKNVYITVDSECDLSETTLNINMPNSHVVISAAAEEEIGAINTITSLNTLVLGEKITVGSVAIQENGGGLTVDGKITGTLSVPDKAAKTQEEPEKVWVKINETARVTTISVGEVNCNLYIAGNVGTVITSAARTTIDGNIATALTANASAEVVVTSNGSVAGAITANGQSEVYIVEGADIEDAALYDYTTTYGENTGSIVHTDEPEAEVNGVEYMTFAKALAMVPTNGVKTTVKLLTDVALEEGFTVAATQNMVLDLNGFTLSEVLSQSGTSALITNNGTLVIQDKTDASANGSGTGKITYNNGNPDQASVPGYASNTIINQGNLTINSGYIENTTTGGYAAYTVDNITNSGHYTPTFTMNGGKLYNNYTDAVRMFLNSTTNLNKVVINGGILDSDKSSGRVVVMHDPGSSAGMGELIITGGTIMGMVNAWSAANDGGVVDRFGDGQYEAINIEISGGSIEKLDFSSMANTTLRASSLSVTGGTFNSDPTEYVAARYFAADNGNGTWTVDGPYVARIGATGYTTLQAAVDAAQSGATIDIITDFTLTTVATEVEGRPNDPQKFNVNVNKSLTINGNNHTITGSQGKRPLAISGTGNTITINDLTVTGTGEYAQMFITSVLTCNLNHVTIDGTNHTGQFNQPLTISTGREEHTIVNINNSVIMTDAEGNDYYAIVVWSPADIAITNSTIKGWANVYLKPGADGSNVSIAESTMQSKGHSGDSNAFGLIAVECANNTITLDNNTAAISEAVGETFNTLLSLSDFWAKDGGTTCTGNTIYVKGGTTFTGDDTKYTGIASDSAFGEFDSTHNNKLYFDDSTVESFRALAAYNENAFIGTSKEDNGYYLLRYIPDVYYYWDNGDNTYTGYYVSLAAPFTAGSGFALCPGEYIALQRDITLHADIECNTTEYLPAGSSFTMTFGDYTITKGDYSIKLATGVSVVTDKPTDIFTAASEGAAIAVTAGTGTYTYTAVAAVAQIGSTRYASLAAAITAANATTGATITLLSDCETGSEYTISNVLKINAVGTTLDLNGKTLTVNNNFSFAVTANNVTVKDGTLASAANSAKATNANSYILVAGGINKTDQITGVNISNVTSTGGGVSIGGSEDSEVKGIAVATMSGCNILSGDYYAICSQNNSTVTINGGTYTSNKTRVNSGVGQLSPGVISGYFVGSDGPQGSINVTGGYFSGAISSNNVNLVNITGGTYTVNPSAFVADGYEATPSDNVWTITQTTGEADSEPIEGGQGNPSF